MSKKTTTANDQKNSLRTFGFIMAGMILLIFGLLFPWLFGDGATSFTNLPKWPFIVAILFVLPAVFYPQLLAPVNRIWLKVGHILGWINSRIILGIMFFLILLPIGLLLKLFGKDSMDRKLNKHLASYRKLSKYRDKQHLERPF